MPDIVLTTLNARYIHASFGLRCLMAGLQSLQSRAALLEFTINDSPDDILAAILQAQPKIAGFGVYIWNVAQTTRIVDDLKRIRPDLLIVLGGPEVSHETEDLPICRTADYVITGEADHAFRELCTQLLDQRPPDNRLIHAPVPDLKSVPLPYDWYSDEDLAHRVIYVEASRGCPFTCEFCLSALDIPVRSFPLPQFLEAMQTLLDRGALQFKFVDRTFNLNLRISRSILEFFLARLRPGLFLHFEMIPDRLPDALKEVIASFPPGVLQFEIGIQTLNPEVGRLISRPQDNEQLTANLRWLRTETGVHLHTDLILGLPGENLQSIADGFDALRALRPQEIQVGILKRLRGTPIARHDQDWEMIYSSHPPYEILSTRLLPYELLLRLKRFARYWDLIANSGRFPASLDLLLDGSASAFVQFLQFSDWLAECEGRRHGIALPRLFERVFEYLTGERRMEFPTVAAAVGQDYARSGRRDRPRFLSDPSRSDAPGKTPDPAVRGVRQPPRQARHQTESPEPPAK